MKRTKKTLHRKREKLYKLPLVLEPQEGGGFTVTCPLLPELITEGDTVQEAIGNVADALTALLEACAALGRQPPAVLKAGSPDTPLWLEAIVSVA
ncbi:MAG: type II toxin-antitoxin system HicB family antitoxin [Acidobacteriota bacterium]